MREEAAVNDKNALLTEKPGIVGSPYWLRPQDTKGGRPSNTPDYRRGDVGFRVVGKTP
jgi:hypothetical protein